MGIGLRLRDANGRVILDTSNRVGKVVSVQVVTPGLNGSFFDPLLTQGKPFASFQRNTSFLMTNPSHVTAIYLRCPVIAIDATGLVTWTYPAASGYYNDASGVIVIGTY